MTTILDRILKRPLITTLTVVALVGISVGCATASGNLRPASAASATPPAQGGPAAGAPNSPPPGVAPAPIGGSAGAAVAPVPAAPPVSAGAAVSAQAIPPIVTPQAGLMRGITVTGSGQVTARPDEALVTAGVQTRASTAQNAQAGNNQTMQAVVDAIKALNIPDKDIQTSGISLYPVYDQGQTVSGYTASNNVTVTVENVDQAGAVLDAAVRAGANQSSGIRFGLKNQTDLRNKALASAAADARSKADALAAALGLQVTGVQAISEQSVGGPILSAPRALAAAGAAPSVPVEPGELTVSAQVTIVFSY